MTSSTGSPVMRDQVDAEQLFGHRVGVEQAAGGVDGDDAAADVAENVFGLVARLLERGDEEVLPFAALAQLRR